MRKSVFAAYLLCLALQLNAEPIPVIFDTDIGNDIDDVLALAMLYEYENRGGADLLAITVSKDNEWTGPFVDLMNRFYGHPGIPIGVTRDGATPKVGKYLKAVATMRGANGELTFPREVENNSELPDAVALLRKVLVGQKNQSVVVVVVGFSTNIARLLKSPPDEHSPLDGAALVKQKVKLLSLMGGKFLYPQFEGEDYNVVKDPGSTRVVFDNWPGRIVASGCALGTRVRYPVSSILTDFDYFENHPLVESYKLYTDKDRPTWDLMSVLYAVEEDRRQDYFELSRPGRLVVDRGNEARWLAWEEGSHYFLSAGSDQLSYIRKRFTELVAESPEETPRDPIH